jgi:hypothetical protein
MIAPFFGKFFLIWESFQGISVSQEFVIELNMTPGMTKKDIQTEFNTQLE